MNHRGTYALLALFFAGLCGLWLADYAKLPTRRDRDRLRSRVLPELLDTKPDELKRVEILGGPEPMAFERRDGIRWQMTTPIDVAADPSMVETLAFNLKEMTRKPEAATLQGNPASFGLAPPERTVKLWGTATDAPIATLEVGKASLDRRYVRAAGTEGVEVVDARGLDLLKLPPVRWRDHELFRVPSLDVDKIRIVGPAGELRLRRDRDGWRIVAPLKTPAAEPKVEGLIADLGSLRVLGDSRFVADGVRGDALDRFGLKSPRLTVEVEAGRDGRRRPSQSILVGHPVEGKDGQVYVKRGAQDAVVAVDARGLRDLGVDPNAYRSPKVADISPARVVRIGVEAEGRDFEVARSGRDWTIVRPAPAPADRQAIEAFLKSLADLQTGIYLTPAGVSDPGLDPPSMVLKVWQAPDPRSEADPGPANPIGTLALTLKVGRRDAARRSIYAQLEGDRTILALPEAAGEFLPRNRLAFRDRSVLAVDSTRIERLTVAGPVRKVALQAPVLKLDPLAQSPIGWWMAEPVTAPADAPAVGRLLKLLSRLRADGLVAEKPGPDELRAFGFEPPALTLTWSTLPSFSPWKGPAFASPGGIPFEDHSLVVGAPVPGRPGQRYATVSGRSLIFTLGPESLGTIDAEYHDHRVLAFDLAHVRRVQLAWPGRSFSLTPAEKDGRRDWSAEGAVDAPDFNPGRVGPLLKAASDLTTTRFAQYLGPIPAGFGLNPPRFAIRVELDDGTPALELRIGDPAAPGLLLATTSKSGDGPVFVVPDALFAGWTRPPRQHDDLPDDVFAR